MTQDHIQRETERVREDWTRRGSHWDRHADAVAETAERMNQPLIDAAGIAPGQKVLDLATGAGEPALTVAGMVGSEGRVYCTDLVPEMMAGAQRRAKQLGVENVEFRTADMRDLPDADDTFDRVTCRFGLMFVPDPGTAAAEVRRVLKPGGRAVFQVWGPPGDTTMFKVFAGAAEEMWGAGDPLIDFKTMSSLGAPGALEAALQEGGFSNVREEEIRFSAKIPADREPWHAQIDMSLGPKLETVSAEERAETERIIHRRFQEVLVDGAYQMDAHVRLGIGEKA